MDTVRWRRVKKILHQAIELNTVDRRAFIHESCSGDDDLREEVESLLASKDESPDSFLESVNPTIDQERRQNADDLAGRRIGPYRLVERIATGGMGAVYRAERADGEFDQGVAIKLIEHVLVTRRSMQRFRRERQTLAGLTHPNIAQLFDGGVTEDGLPYLVLEYVKGESITAFCDERRMSVTERLALFRNVCSAVTHAHRNLVVHCDLKPHNILVTSDGTVKLLDFGIARALSDDGDSSNKTSVTSQSLMTPGYASPEQVRGEGVSTATDIYSLGVILYELLTGRRPYVVTGRTPSEIERTVCGYDPVKPSTASHSGDTSMAPHAEMQDVDACTHLANLRGLRPSRLRRRLSGDLDNIVMMAMRKEPQRRYVSVEHFDDDLRRHLEGMPVAARGDDVAYRAVKFVKRHAISVTAVSVVALALTAGVIGVAWQAGIAADERDAARASALEAEHINEFLQNMITSARPEIARDPDITVREVLDRAAERIGDDLASEPQVAARIRFTLGQTYASLGLYDEAQPLLADAVEAYRRAVGADHVDYAAALNEKAVVHYRRGEFDEAIVLLDEARTVYERVYGWEHPKVSQCLNDQGAVYKAKGDIEMGESFCRQALDMRRRLLGNEHLDVAVSLNNLAGILMAKGDMHGAAGICREVLDIRRRLSGDEHPEVAQSHNNLAVVLMRTGDVDGARSHMADALAIYREVLPEGHPVLVSTLGNLAAIHTRSGAHEEAVSLLTEVLVAKRANLGNEHLSVANSLWNLAAAYRGLDRHADAEPALRECLAIRTVKLDGDDASTIAALHELGRCLCRQGKLIEAERFLLDCHRRCEAALGPDNERTLDAAQWLVRTYKGLGRTEEAARFESFVGQPVLSTQ